MAGAGTYQFGFVPYLSVAIDDSRHGSLRHVAAWEAM